MGRLEIVYTTACSQGKIRLPELEPCGLRLYYPGALPSSGNELLESSKRDVLLLSHLLDWQQLMTPISNRQGRALGRDATTTAKAFAFSFEPLGICSSLQAMKHSSWSLTRHTYLVIRWSCVSYSSLTFLTTSLESLCMMIFSKDTEIVRSILDRIVSYSTSFLDVGSLNCIACFILSPVRALSCKPTPAPVYLEAPSTLRFHQSELPEFASCWGISAKNSAFIAKRGLYWIPNSLSSIVHRAILLNKLGLCMVLCKGRLVNTTIGCAWK